MDLRVHRICAHVLFFYRRMSPEETNGIDQLTGLSELDVPTVMEVFSAEVTESLHGKIAIFTASCDGEGKKSPKKVVVPIRFQRYTFILVKLRCLPHRIPTTI